MTADPDPSAFFQAGGSLPADAPSYVRRGTDDRLLGLCQQGEYCTVLTSRQVGKSSLVIQAMRRLREDGVTAICLDLQGFQKVSTSAERFYYGIANDMLDAVAECRDRPPPDLGRWWNGNAGLDFLHRLTRLVEQEVLNGDPGRVVVFVDEVDMATTLPFSDDFFMWVRSLYAARPRKPQMRALSFVLVGVADPGDLIRDPSRTPYNIGARLALDDFTLDELGPYAEVLAGAGVEDAGEVMRHVHRWTAGHPYLTQRLCQDVVADGRRRWTVRDVEELVRRIFTGPDAAEQSHLPLVRKMLELRTSTGSPVSGGHWQTLGPDRTEVLGVYRDVVRGLPIPDEQRSGAKGFLKLTGLLRSSEGLLEIRNPIYGSVFDGEWVSQQLDQAQAADAGPDETVLRLDVLDWEDGGRWRWRLTDAGGDTIADLAVPAAPADPNLPHVFDLGQVLARQAEVDSLAAERAARWLGRAIWGQVGEAIVERAPVTVLVGVPDEARLLLQLPLELGFVGDAPIGAHGVSLVVQPPGAPVPAPVVATSRVRMLAVFASPTGARTSSPRGQRRALAQVVSTLRGRERRAVDLHVLEYGVTAERLAAVLVQPPGWDVVHLACGVATDGLVLEGEDGTPEVVAAATLAELLQPARPRLKLLTLISSRPPADTTATALQIEAVRGSGGPGGAGDLAAGLARGLDCAAVTVRSSVSDEFAAHYSSELYRLMLGGGLALTRAVQVAGRKVALRGTHLQSTAAVTVFGPRGAALRFAPPEDDAPSPDVASRGQAGFPSEPGRFVGRVGLLTRASRALEPGSRRAGVVLHGIPGIGKTAAALELAHCFRDAYEALVWYRVPARVYGAGDALMGLALELRMRAPASEAARLLGQHDRPEAFVRDISEFLAQHPILLVLDRLDPLLSDEGVWHDERWGWLMESLDGDGSRVVLASRRLPSSLPSALVVERVGPLNLEESVQLCGELDWFGALSRGEGGIDEVEARTLVLRALAVTQGHPRLLELADGAASDPAALERWLTMAERSTAAQPRSRAFLDTGVAAMSPDEHTALLAAWDPGAVADLVPPDAFVEGVAEVCQLRHRSASVHVVDLGDRAVSHLRVATTTELGVRQYAVGVFENGMGIDDLERFADEVHDRYRQLDPLVMSDLVHGGEAAPEGLVDGARRRGVRVFGFGQFQEVVDLSGYVTRQTIRVCRDPLYPPALYVPQRFREQGRPDHDVRPDLARELMGLVAGDEGRFVLVLGDFGRGKTFLLREVARRMAESLPHVVPILIELHALDKAHSVDGLVAAHLANHGEELIDLRAFHYMLRQGRIVLLLDGFDELVTRIPDERAADHLETLLAAAEGRAKIVVTSRNQQFQSQARALTHLGQRVTRLASGRILELEVLTPAQIHAYIVTHQASSAARDSRVDSS